MANRLVLKIRLFLALLALVLPPLALIVLGIGFLLFQRQALGLAACLTWLTVAAAIGAGGVAALISGRSAGWIAWRWMLLLALPAAAPLAAGAYVTSWLQQHPSGPDISTDLVDPPAMGGVAAPMSSADAAAQRARHPQVQSLALLQSTDAAFLQAASLARAQGWTVTREGEGTIEGYGQFGHFRYTRGWSIRIRPELKGGALVDMRIRSRPGEPDFGQNAEVVTSFLKRLQSEAPL